MQKTAVVLFNLGGPDGPDAVEPFLFNLFNDPAIIGAPGPIRWLLAKLISKRRAPIAREIYANLGGGSPLLPNTRRQAEALESTLETRGETKVFIAMRYWHPLTEEAVASVKAYGPDRVILLPLYPQFSTTTTGSSLRAWHAAAERAGLQVPTTSLCCYPVETGLIKAMADRLRSTLSNVEGDEPVRVLFSAHGLPKKVIAAGDPYQWQVEQTAAAVIASLGKRNVDWIVCYQSRVGPLEWIGPSTEDEIRRAGKDGLSLVVQPIAFVSEHSETLVELDIEYRRLAEETGVRAYHRVATVDASPDFIGGLSSMVQSLQPSGPGICTQFGGRYCPAHRLACPYGSKAERMV